MAHENLLGGPGSVPEATPPTLLPDEPEPRRRIADGEPPAAVAADFPASSLAWATLAEAALSDGRDVEGYAYARTGYHRGLDSLRRNGWRGTGPVPWEHEPNRGFLRALYALGVAAGRIGEDDEAARCTTFLADSSPTAVSALGAGEH
jgi:hypothetical protein